jgi:hypothetical protein
LLRSATYATRCRVGFDSLIYHLGGSDQLYGRVTMLVAIVAVFMVLGVVLATRASAWAAVITEAPASVTQFPQFVEEIGGAVLFGSLALVGGNGFNLLVQSNYIRDKGLGMGRYIPRIVSPITGHEEARPSLGYMFPQTEENLRRWRGWWRLANQEQLLVFFLLGVITLVMLPVLTYSCRARRRKLGGGIRLY